jgi:hypothetical protein
LPFLQDYTDHASRNGGDSGQREPIRCWQEGWVLADFLEFPRDSSES